MPADCGVQSPYRKPVTVIMEKNIQKLQRAGLYYNRTDLEKEREEVLGRTG